MAAATAAIALAGVSILSTGVGLSYQRRAGKQEKKARRAQQRLEEFRATKAKRREIRAARIQRAEVENLAVQSGTAGSSGVAGGVAGIQTQAASNISAIGVQTGLAGEASGHLQRAAGFRGKAATAQAIGSVATIFAGEKGFEGLGKTLFGK